MISAVQAVNPGPTQEAARCTFDEAKAITERIRGAVECVWQLLKEAHDRKAWLAVGYQSWEAYVREEFQISRSQSYRLLDYAKVTAALSPNGDVTISEAQARPLAGLEPEEQRRVWDQAVKVSGGAPTAQAVKRIVAAGKASLPDAQKDQAGDGVAVSMEIIARAAAATGASIPDVIDAMKIKQAAPDVFERVHSGELTLSEAKRMVAERKDPKVIEADEVIPPKPDGRNYRPSIGMMHADNAISQLAKIQLNDTELEMAFERVSAWMQNQSRRARGGAC